MRKPDQVKVFVNDVKTILKLPINSAVRKFEIPEYPFDTQMLSLSPLYFKSRQAYLKLGGKHVAAVCSTMRSLSTQDLFKNEIHYSPMHSEMVWLYENAKYFIDTKDQVSAIQHFHAISIFHEQNHRIIWQLMPKAPTDKINLRRYLNFAESLVVMLDLALADQINPKVSKSLERMSLLYRPAGSAKLQSLTTTDYRQYLLSAFVATYCMLERVNGEDILKVVNYVLPENKKINKQAVHRGLELNQDFTEVTNPGWQEIYWQSAAVKLKEIHKKSKAPVLVLPQDPLDLELELSIVEQVLNYFEVG